MSLKGHGEAVRFMKDFKIPMLVTGGELSISIRPVCVYPVDYLSVTRGVIRDESDEGGCRRGVCE